MNLLEHLLTCTAEEGGEVSQAAHKALRFGLDDINPKTQRTNLQDIVSEFNDLIGALELLQEEGVNLQGLYDRQAIESKKARINALAWAFQVRWHPCRRRANKEL